MTVEGTLRIVLATDDDARHAAQALAPDDDGSCELALEGRTLIVSARATTPMGLLRTLDDVLACLRATGMP